MKSMIDTEFDMFFEFPTDDRSTVSSVSCKLFARRVADMVSRQRDHIVAVDKMVEPVSWVKITQETIIPAGRPLLAYYEYPTGFGRRVRARHVPAFTEEAAEECAGHSSYDEETDTHYVRAGWYEWNEHEETIWMIVEEVTHYMELPSPPEPCK